LRLKIFCLASSFTAEKFFALSWALLLKIFCLALGFAAEKFFALP